MRYTVGFFPLVAVLFLHSCGPDPGPEVIKPDPKTGEFVLEVSSEMPPVRISEDNPFTREGIDLGRHLFYEKMLSGDNSQSCGTCHGQIFAFTDHLKSVSEGITGALGTRNTMPLFNLMWHDSFFWDKRAFNLRHQVLMPIENPIEMNARLNEVVSRLNESSFYRSKFKAAFGEDVIDTTLIAKALEQFLSSMVSENSRFDRFNRGELQLTPAELRGFDRLKIKGCFNCHKGNLFMDNMAHNTGLDYTPADNGMEMTTGKVTDRYKFKTPTLRNVMVSAPYMHDGRFETIEEVLNFYDHDIHFNSPNVNKVLLEIGTRAQFTQQDIEDVKAFFSSLTDYQYLSDERFSDPF